MQSRTISGTQKLHSFVPISRSHVKTRVYSLSAEFKEERVNAIESELSRDDIRGFVSCAYEKKWWLACVLQVEEMCEQVTLSFLHPHGPSRSFKYPSRPDILSVPVTDILTTVDPRTATGRTYTLTKKDSQASIKKLDLYNNYTY